MALRALATNSTSRKRAQNKKHKTTLRFTGQGRFTTRRIPFEAIPTRRECRETLAEPFCEQPPHPFSIISGSVLFERLSHHPVSTLPRHNGFRT
jgi:hypothetical protein